MRMLISLQKKICSSCRNLLLVLLWFALGQVAVAVTDPYLTFTERKKEAFK